jgi:ribonuclease M5
MRNNEPMTVKEVIIVEGRNDSAAIKRSVSAATIETHGFGISAETLALIEKAYLDKGIIIFTDPDFSGGQIRKKLSERFPKAKHAYLTRKDASKDGGIGVENSGPEAIIEAIQKAKASFEDTAQTFTYEDIHNFGLAGDKDSSEKRAEIGKILGIGYGNAKTFLNKLNQYGVTTEEFNEAILACGYRRA